MRALVTGGAGFIGSVLAGRLASLGHDVTVVDCFTPYYEPELKRANLSAATASGPVSLVEADLRSVSLRDHLAGIDVVFHQAAQPGVRASWGRSFPDYVSHNILATQRLLDDARAAKVDRVIFASSSSVYGNALQQPTDETAALAPFSPYGVTKLGGEHLCRVYTENYGLHTLMLRYFTVYGPRQRPDMALHRLIECALTSTRFLLYGEGEQVRDFTYVGDVVEALLLAAQADLPPATCLNIAGGSSVVMRDLVDLTGDVVGSPVPVERLAAQPGDVHCTGGATERAAALLGWEPSTPMEEGLRAQVQWHRARRAQLEGTTGQSVASPAAAVNK